MPPPAKAGGGGGIFSALRQAKMFSSGYKKFYSAFCDVPHKLSWQDALQLRAEQVCLEAEFLKALGQFFIYIKNQIGAAKMS